MPLNTNLSASPYFDDFDGDDNYYRILFKPATAVQVREVNQLQTILHDQMEQFGDHILKAGTILEGCQFTYLDSMPFVKIEDNSITGTAIDLDVILGLSANGQTSGQYGTPHVDDGEYTLLYYPNPDWNFEWQGNLNFLDLDHEIGKIISYKPNRLVCFPADMVHYADPPSIKFNGLRISLAYKLVRK